MTIQPEDDSAPEGGAAAAEDVLEFTPDPEAEIGGIARSVFEMMDDYGMDCDIHFPDFTMEVPKGTPAEDIVAAYHDILAQLAGAEGASEEA